MPNFRKYSCYQHLMIVFHCAEQLKPGTFKFTLHKLIDEHIDLVAFHKNHNNDADGRSAYAPAIFLNIILFAYPREITSGWDIQWECERNVTFKALFCDSVPRFTGIASYPEAIKSVCEQVLLIYCQQRLLGRELFAIDRVHGRRDKAADRPAGT